VSVTRELIIFFYFILGGMVGGIFFDLLRITRKNREIGDIVVYLEDIIFWLLMGCEVIWLSYVTDAGQIRIYMIAGLFLGMLIYFLTLTKIVYKVLDFACRYLVWLFGVVFKIFKGANNEKEKSELV